MGLYFWVLEINEDYRHSRSLCKEQDLPLAGADTTEGPEHSMELTLSPAFPASCEGLEGCMCRAQAGGEGWSPPEVRAPVLGRRGGC